MLLLVVVHLVIHLLSHTTIIHLVILLVLLLIKSRVLLSINVVHLWRHLTILERGEVARRSSDSKLLVLFLGLVELLSPLVNGEIHKFKVLTLLIFIHFFVTSASCTSTQDLNLLLELVLLLPHLIDSLNQVDVVIHQSSVVLTVLLQVARQLLTIVVDVSFISVSLTCVLSILIDSGNSLFTLSFFLDPGLVEADDTALELLVVSDVLDNFKDIILELCLLELLEI